MYFAVQWIVEYLALQGCADLQLLANLQDRLWANVEIIVGHFWRPVASLFHSSCCYL
jgi:hypothetical protein